MLIILCDSCKSVIKQDGKIFCNVVITSVGVSAYHREEVKLDLCEDCAKDKLKVISSLDIQESKPNVGRLTDDELEELSKRF